MKTPSTILTIQIQSVETRYFSPQHTSPTSTLSLVLWLMPSSSLFQNTFVGLTNLGATCYVNTFLQVWFHNLELRRSLYECNSSRAQEHNTGSGTSETHVFHVFLRTGISTKHWVVVFCNCCFQIMSPSPSVSICSICLHSCRTATGSTLTHQVWSKLWAWTLASSRYSTTLNWWLTLKETTDFFYFQDAQEFSKLFLSLLENTLSKQKNSSLQNVIQRQFCGQFSYVTVWEDSFWLNIV